ncbi:hypothetical protein SGM_6175 [Streptomyces griseoaurantiacus M045]|uniref:Uncharacterized protein n=1 Tax=Streptomyces griseoaurantiacus M045 TaxID=996637 RepID=F3NSR1_9ACTN|nr:hypothetical protein SGM_6175 [Streptomyces griseoaurantiacus M045]
MGGGRDGCGRQRPGLPVGAAGPQVEGDLAGQDDGAGRGGQQQAPVEQGAQPGRGVGGDLAVGGVPTGAGRGRRGSRRGPRRAGRTCGRGR